MARKKPRARGPQLDLAGDLSVAFVNTAAARDNNTQRAVRSYSDLVLWGLESGTLPTLEAERLRRLASERPSDADATFTAAKAVRRALRRIFLALAAGRALPEDDLRRFNESLSAALPALRLIPGEEGPAWGWEGDPDALDRMLWPVLHGAGQLLVSTEGRPHVRRCAGYRCGLLFVDRSPSGRRIWCEMEPCGRRTKSLEYYFRQGKAYRDKKWWGSGAYHVRRPRERMPAGCDDD